MEVSSPGKVLMLGGYAVLDYYPAYSVAVEDRQGRGVVAEAEIGERRVISEQFNMDLDPKEPNSPPEAAYLVAERFLRKYGGQSTTVRLRNSPIFGSDEEKSGLGSSSASIVSTVAAMFEANGLPIEENRDKIHLLSQVANAIYAKKVGSGYDIASAAYGSIVYTRFSPSTLDGVGVENVEEAFRREWKPMMVQRVEPPWDILVFNVKGKRTSTISAVKVFRKAKELYGEQVSGALKMQAEAEKEALARLRQSDARRFREAMHRAREAHRKLSSVMKKVDENFEGIEPEPLREFIEEVEKLEGVVAGRCHGGGGWDGVAFFVEKGFNAEEVLEKASVEVARVDVKVNLEGVKDVGEERVW